VSYYLFLIFYAMVQHQLTMMSAYRNTGLLAERCGIRPNEFWDADSKVVAYKTIIPK
jgi:hypothetical protein